MSKRYIIKFKNIQDFKQYVEDTNDMYPCIIQVPTPAGIAVGYSYDDSTFDIYIHKYLISTDNLHTMNLSSATTVDAVAVQDIIEQWQEGDRMTFSHDVVLYLKGELILGEYAHWENDTLVYGDGRGTPYYYDYYYGYYDYYDYEYPYEEEYDYLQVWYTDGTTRKYEVTVIDRRTSPDVENYQNVVQVVLGNKVTSIDCEGFLDYLSLKSITIGKNVTCIDTSDDTPYPAFSGCYSMEYIRIKEGNSVYDSRDNCNAIIETSTNKLIKGCKNTVIPSSVTSIGYNAFSGCSGLTSITIPDGVTSIGGGAFVGCSGLTSITIPDGVTSIGSGAFWGCSGLTSVTIPNSVTSIGREVFDSCDNLQSIASDGLQVILDVTSSEQQFDKYSIQSVIDTIQEGGAIEFSHESALYLKGELVLGDKAHWDGDTLMYGPNGSGYYYDYSYDYQEDGDEIDDTDDGEAVDLGLPSGTKWMKSNIGATKPSDFGKFFQWGDTQGYSGVDDHQFNWDDYKYGTSSSLTKYNNTDHLKFLEPSDDSAAAATSGGASMPTARSLQELINYTEHRWLRLANGVNGMKFWKKGTEEPTDGNSYIFIPAAGNCGHGYRRDVGSFGYVWSVSRDESSANLAWGMFFDAGYVDIDYNDRCSGFSVRAVVSKNI